MAAFQCLGSFISTFADSSITGLYFNEQGMLTVGNPNDFKRYVCSTAHELETTTASHRSALVLILQPRRYPVVIGIIDHQGTCDFVCSQCLDISGATNDGNANTVPLAHEDLNLTPEDMDVEDVLDQHSVTQAVSNGSGDSESIICNENTATAGESTSMIEQSTEEKRADHYREHPSNNPGGDGGSSHAISDLAGSSTERKALVLTQAGTSTDPVESNLDIASDSQLEPGKIVVPEVTQPIVDQEKSIANLGNDVEVLSDCNVGAAQSMKDSLNLDVSSLSCSPAKCDSSLPTVESSSSSLDLQSPETYSSFMYWRDPLPEINIESVLDSESDQSPVITNNVGLEQSDATPTRDALQSSDLRKLEDIHLEESQNTAELDRFLSDLEGMPKYNIVLRLFINIQYNCCSYITSTIFLPFFLL